MNGPQHYQEAERLGDYANGTEDVQRAAVTVALAQMHATLALTAATVDPDDGDLWAQVIL